jgi:PPK2 family polyphosphate:nucleotide phosphotransferase
LGRFSGVSGAKKRRRRVVWMKRFIVRPGEAAGLDGRDPGEAGPIADKAEGEAETEQNRRELDDAQELLWADNSRALLVVLQGMDTCGKDGTIRHVMTGVSPQGCVVTSFKVPNEEERDHDYLWRVHKAAPRKGEIGVFNRSHYEDVLVVRVHGLVTERVWRARYEEINAFEKHLHENGTRILKFFLHISKGEQKKRLRARLDDPKKNWKFSEGDIEERKLWDEYMEAYEEAITRCSTEWAPWFVIPADRKWFRNLAVSEIITEALKDMNLKWPRPAADLSKIRL